MTLFLVSVRFGYNVFFGGFYFITRSTWRRNTPTFALPDPVRPAPLCIQKTQPSVSPAL
jgi:hypothetical protein